MTTRRTLTHWGAYDVRVNGDQIESVTGVIEDPDPAPIIDPIRNGHRNRVTAPAVRKSWLENGVFSNPERRGDEPLIDVSWKTALDLIVEALRGVREASANSAIYGGSYGWGSAGRFHHPQSQLKRFLNTLGGFTSSIGTYSHGAAEVVVPAVAGVSFGDFQRRSSPLPDAVAGKTELFVSFGGFPAHNARITSGGDVDHWYRPTLRSALLRGCKFVSIAPTIGELDRELDADWIRIRPGTDTALLLGVAGQITIDEGQTVWPDDDRSHSQFLKYLTGQADGQVKDAHWASGICGVEPNQIADLAQVMTRRSTLLNATWSTQRIEHGEQAAWATLALGALLDQSPSSGGGVTLGYGSMGSVGAPVVTQRPASFPQRNNPISMAIPVARLADALLNPGGPYTYAGREVRYPKLELVYWCGGNPFHHNQDLHRLRDAWRKPRAVIVHEPAWTATARHADIVMPSTFGFERADLGGASTAGHFVHMEQVVTPPGSARDDYEIFTDLAERLGVHDEFTEGRSAAEWIEELYRRTRAQIPEIPPFDEFTSQGIVERPARKVAQIAHSIFEFDEECTPTGATPYPQWLEPTEWLGAATDQQLHLLSPMPAERLHSQHGGEPGAPPLARINRTEADKRDLGNGDIIEVWNSRGSMQARLSFDKGVSVGVISIENGYPFDPRRDDSDRTCAGGNVNVLTADRPTSDWAQATTAHSCLVQIGPAR